MPPLPPEKKTRIKGIPPLIQLDDQDNKSSIPVSPLFNDRNTVDFGIEQDLNAGMNISSDSPVLDNPEYKTDITYNGPLRKGVADAFIQYDTGSVQTINPFVDFMNPGADGKSNNDPFFVTGSVVSQVGEGFAGPLWSKEKLEIDISSPNGGGITQYISQTFGTFDNSSFIPAALRNYDYQHGTMAYYNFSSKRWEGVSIGQPINRGQFWESPPFNEMSEVYATIGFNPGIVNCHYYDRRVLTGSYPGALEIIQTSSMITDALNVNNMFEYHKMSGRYTDQYGFPSHPKYYADSHSSYPVSNLIDRPFLVEKISLIMNNVNYKNADIQGAGLSSVVAPYSINNFFVLNQRRNTRFRWKSQFYNGLTASTPTERVQVKYQSDTGTEWAVPGVTFDISSILSGTNNVIPVTSSRDLIGYASIVGVSDDFDRDITRYYGSANSPLPFSEMDDRDGTTEPKHFFFRNGVSEPGTETANGMNDLLRPGRDKFISTVSLDSRLTNLDWEESVLEVNFDAKSPVPCRDLRVFNDPFACYESKSLETPESIFTDTGVSAIRTDNGGRNALGATNPTGRDLINSYGQPSANYNDQVVYIKEDNYTAKTHYSQIDGEALSKSNPYLLMPGDELIFGWQLPIPKCVAGSTVNPNGTTDYTGSFINTGSIGDIWGAYNGATTPFEESFIPPGTTTPVLVPGLLALNSISFNGSAKVILYGSYVDNGEECQNFVNEGKTAVESSTYAVSTVLGECQKKKTRE